MLANPSHTDLVISLHLRRSPSTPAPAQPPTAHTYNPSEPYPPATAETAPYAETCSPAYAHTQPPPPAPAATPPTTDPSPPTTGSAHPASSRWQSISAHPAHGCPSNAFTRYGCKKLHQLPPLRHRKTRTHANMLQRTRRVIKPQQQRSYRRPFPTLMPPKPRNHAVAVPLMLHLQHHPLVRLIRPLRSLRHHPIKPRTLKSLEPILRLRMIPSRRRHMHRSLRTTKHLLQPLSPLRKRSLPQILIPHPQQIEEHHRSRNLPCQQLHP